MYYFINKTLIFHMSFIDITTTIYLYTEIDIKLILVNSKATTEYMYLITSIHILELTFRAV